VTLADLGNSHEVVSTTRTVPISGDMLIQLVAMTLLPIVPLLLTMISLEELFRQLLKIVF
jgi:hypothetical protein